ncbi:MAG TPA: phage head closure protein [Phycisphaerales bacterium]|nr:phage head closure protein [Phycisphaerales bacterium]
MRAGKLRKRAIIQQATTTASAMGQPVESYSTWATVWASLEYDPAGSEAYEAVQRVGKTGARIVVRYRQGYVAGMRAVIDGQVFKVDAVAEMKPRNEVHLTCTLLQPRSGPES